MMHLYTIEDFTPWYGRSDIIAREFFCKN